MSLRALCSDNFKSNRSGHYNQGSFGLCRTTTSDGRGRVRPSPLTLASAGDAELACGLPGGGGRGDRAEQEEAVDLGNDRRPLAPAAGRAAAEDPGDQPVDPT